jgi:hypothetical protein
MGIVSPIHGFSCIFSLVVITLIMYLIVQFREFLVLGNALVGRILL